MDHITVLQPIKLTVAMAQPVNIKISEKAAAPTAVVWGAITGTLADQVDLKAVLDNKQPLDSDLTTIAGLTASDGNFMMGVSGSWASRTPAQALTVLGLDSGGANDIWVKKAGDTMSGALVSTAKITSNGFEDTLSGLLSNSSNTIQTRNVVPRASLSSSIGGSGAYYSNIYGQTQFFNSTATIDGTIAGRLTMVGAPYAGSLTLNSTVGIKSDATSSLVRISGGVQDDGAVIILGGSTNGSIPNQGNIRVGSSTMGSWTSTGFAFGSSLTAAPTHTITLASSGTGIAAYNTTDQTTNHERVRMYWAANAFNIASEQGGTGAARPIQIISNNGNSALLVDNSSANGAVKVTGTSGVAGGSSFRIIGTLSASSSSQYSVNIAPTINQSGTAGYIAHLVNVTETTTGSGLKLLSDWQVGSSSLLSINNVGRIVVHSTSATEGLAIHDTVDEVTNYSRLHIYSSGGVTYVNTEVGGSGTLLPLSVGSTTTVRTVYNLNSATSKIRHDTGTSSIAQKMVDHTGGFNSSSIFQSFFNISPVINTSGTASNTDFLLNRTQTNVGSGAQNLMDLQVGGVPMFTVSNIGTASIAAAGSFLNYNTVDQITNFERNKQSWVSNVFTITNESGGTGVNRDVSLIGNGSSIVTIGGLSSSIAVTISRGATSYDLVRLTSTGFTKSSGVQYGLRIDPVINQSATGGYTAILVNPTETAVGSGAQNLMDLQVGSVSKFRVTNAGALITASTMTVGGTITVSGQVVATGFRPTGGLFSLGMFSPATNTLAFSTNTTLQMSIGPSGTMFIADNTSVPATNPVGGGFLYVESGALKYRGSSGTVTVLGVA